MSFDNSLAWIGVIGVRCGEETLLRSNLYDDEKPILGRNSIALVVTYLECVFARGRRCGSGG